MKLEKIIKGITVNEIIGDASQEISGINMDSRLIEPGHIFVAVKGTQTDGHTYIQKAIEKGARTVVCENLPETLIENVTYIKVNDTEDVVGKLATTFYGDPTSKLELVGVTGTNGKTTIATLLYNMFRKFGYKTGLISTVCNYIDEEAIPTDHTTPDPITLNKLLGRMADEGCKYAFMEVSSHSVAQKRIGGLKFAGGIFTNLTRDHLDYHKTVENYLKAKKAFFDSLPKTAFALTNLDDKNGLVMTQNTKAKVHTYSLRSLSDFKGKVLEDGFEGMLLDINNVEVNVQFIGRFNASNLLAVYGAACLLGKKTEEVLLALSTQCQQYLFCLFPKQAGCSIDSQQVGSIETSDELYIDFHIIYIKQHSFESIFQHFSFKITQAAQRIGVYLCFGILSHDQSVFVIQIG